MPMHTRPTRLGSDRGRSPLLASPKSQASLGASVPAFNVSTPVMLRRPSTTAALPSPGSVVKTLPVRSPSARAADGDSQRPIVKTLPLRRTNSLPVTAATRRQGGSAWQPLGGPPLAVGSGGVPANARVFLPAEEAGSGVSADGSPISPKEQNLGNSSNGIAHFAAAHRDSTPPENPQSSVAHSGLIYDDSANSRVGSVLSPFPFGHWNGEEKKVHQLDPRNSLSSDPLLLVNRTSVSGGTLGDAQPLIVGGQSGRACVDDAPRLSRHKAALGPIPRETTRINSPDTTPQPTFLSQGRARVPGRCKSTSLAELSGDTFRRTRSARPRQNRSPLNPFAMSMKPRTLGQHQHRSAQPGSLVESSVDSPLGSSGGLHHHSTVESAPQALCVPQAFPTAPAGTQRPAQSCDEEGTAPAPGSAQGTELVASPPPSRRELLFESPCVPPTAAIESPASWTSAQCPKWPPASCPEETRQQQQPSLGAAGLPPTSTARLSPSGNGFSDAPEVPLHRVAPESPAPPPKKLPLASELPKTAASAAAPAPGNRASPAQRRLPKMSCLTLRAWARIARSAPTPLPPTAATASPARAAWTTPPTACPSPPRPSSVPA